MPYETKTIRTATGECEIGEGYRVDFFYDKFGLLPVLVEGVVTGINNGHITVRKHACTMDQFDDSELYTCKRIRGLRYKSWMANEDGWEYVNSNSN